MKKILISIFIFIILISNVNASSIIMDMDNNRVLYSSNSNEQRLIASTTKIMTALLAIESNRLEEIVTVGEEVLTMYGSNIYIKLNEQILLLDLVYGLMMQSGNDASVVIANFVGGSEEKFVKMMNDKAKELGLKDTIYNNPHGLDEETKNYSTAHDLCTLYSYAYKSPMFRKIVGTKYHKVTTNFNSYSWKNKNKLLFDYEYTTGGKTGYTPDAGRILVSSASKDDLNICIATLDSNSYLYDFHQTKYEGVFKDYKKYKILDKTDIEVVGIEETLYIDNDFYYTLKEDEYKNINIKTNIDKKTNYKNGEKIGEIYVYLDDEIIEKQNIYVKIKNEGLITKIGNFIKKILSSD